MRRRSCLERCARRSDDLRDSHNPFAALRPVGESAISSSSSLWPTSTSDMRLAYRQIAGSRGLDTGYRVTSSSSPSSLPSSWRAFSFRRRPGRLPDPLLDLEPCSVSSHAWNDPLCSEQLPELLQADLNVRPSDVSPVVVFAPASL